MTALYKVLMDGKSFHGGTQAWSLPTQKEHGEWKPGKWVKCDQPPIPCASGLHLTREPARWWAEGATCYLAEGDGEGGQRDDKIVFASARLLRPLDPDELASVRIYTLESHNVTVTDGYAIAFGRSTVRAYGNSTVSADGNSTVRAYGNSTVRAYGNSTVSAYGNSTVSAAGDATVNFFHKEPAELTEGAVAIDRRSWRKPKVRTAADATAN